MNKKLTDNKQKKKPFEWLDLKRLFSVTLISLSFSKLFFESTFWKGEIDWTRKDNKKKEKKNLFPSF